ncbi:MAG: hypothetical protein WCT04_06225 [Planctomycetota bacterium]
MKTRTHKITVYDDNGRGRRWKPRGPTRTATPLSRREHKIVRLILNGQTADFAKAIELMRKGVDYDRILDLGGIYKRTGRVIKTLIVADKIISGEIPKDEEQAYIHGLAISAGNRG